jgi:hypothetical protein
LTTKLGFFVDNELEANTEVGNDETAEINETELRTPSTPPKLDDADMVLRVQEDERSCANELVIEDAETDVSAVP